MYTPTALLESPIHSPGESWEPQLKADNPQHTQPLPTRKPRRGQTEQQQFSLKETCGFSGWNFCLPDIQRMANAELSPSVKSLETCQPICLTLCIEANPQIKGSVREPYIQMNSKSFPGFGALSTHTQPQRTQHVLMATIHLLKGD